MYIYVVCMHVVCMHVHCGNELTCMSMYIVCRNVHVKPFGHTVFIEKLHIYKSMNLEREYRDCIKSRRDKIGITRHIMMHQVLYNVHVTLFIGQLHNI